MAKPPPEPVFLRPLTRADLPRIQGWRSNRELYGWLAGDFRPSTLVDEERWFAAYEADRERQRRYAIVRAADGAHIGNVYLLDIGPQGAEFHIFIAEPAARGRGYGEAATRLALEEAFGPLALPAVRLQVLEHNAPARSLYAKLGFVAGDATRATKDGGEAMLLSMRLARDAWARAGQPR